MLKNLDKKLKEYSYILAVASSLLTFIFIVSMFYNMLNKGSLNIIEANGNVTSIPYWIFIVLALYMLFSWLVVLLLVYSVGEILGKLTEFENMIEKEKAVNEKKRISKLVTGKQSEKSTEVKENKTTAELNAELDILKDVDDSEDTSDYTMELENKEIKSTLKELPNYRLELSNAFFDKLKPIKLNSTQERAVYDNVENALLTNEFLVLTTVTAEGQRVNVNIPTNVLGHVTDNVEAFKDSLKIFRKLTKIQIAKDFIWKM